MDVFSTLRGQDYVWDSDKAARNIQRHNVQFEYACEAFLDQMALYEDASTPEESRQPCIGAAMDFCLLYVVHVERENNVIRMISARVAGPAERRRYEDE